MGKESVNLYQIFWLFRYNAPVRPRFQPEYQPIRSQYESQYQGQQLQAAYPSPAIPAGPQGHVATNVNAGLASYTVNYKR